MNSFKQYLIRNKNKYPNSEIKDYLKQIYQSEFAGGHMIKSKESSLEFLIKEYKLINTVNNVLYEYISDNIIRLNIKPAISHYEFEIINNLFYESSILHRNSNLLKDKCNDLISITNTNSLITEFANNPQPTHHSDLYRLNYNPHYRVIDTSLLPIEFRINKLQSYIDSISKDKLTIVAIEGRCASGKTTITNKIKNATIIHADDFFSKTDVLDFDLLIKLIEKLEIGKNVKYTAYNCSKNEYYTKTIESVEPVVIIEGVYSNHPKIRKFINKLVYIETTKKLQSERLKQRTKDANIYNKFINLWIPREEKYFYENTYIIDADIII